MRGTALARARSAMSNPTAALRIARSRGTASPVRASSVLAPLFVATFLFGCTSTVTGTGSSSSSGSSGSSQPTESASGSGTSTGSNGSTPPDTNEWEALFGPPETSTVTENTIGGLWAGQTSYDDLRLKFTGTSVTIAIKCRTGAIGTKVAAQVSGASIRIVESQQIGAEYDSCSIKVRPQTIPKCENEYDSYNCFLVKGTTLRFNGVTLFTAGSYGPSGDLTKLSD